MESKTSGKQEKNKNEEDIIVVAKPKGAEAEKNTANNNNNRQLYSRDSKGFLQCELCHKKFTKMNFESHLNECKQKYKDKKNGTFMNKPSFVPAAGSPAARQPMMPAVNYGGFSNKPKFNLKFGK